MSKVRGGAEYRKILNSFSIGEIKSSKLAAEYPNCICENADSPVGSPGKVTDDELLRIFLTSSYKRVNTCEGLVDKSITDLFKVRSLYRVFSDGLSAYRLNFVSEQELIYSVEVLYDSLTKDTTNKNSGGVYGSIDIGVGEIRNAAKSVVPFCVYETPQDPISGKGFKRPSHVDILWADSLELNEDDQSACEDLLYNVIEELTTLNLWVEKRGNKYSYNEKYVTFLPKKIRPNNKLP